VTPLSPCLLLTTRHRTLRIHDESFRSYCVFYIGTSAFLSILINGATTKWLLR
jgi:hypothetical protein